MRFIILYLLVYKTKGRSLHCLNDTIFVSDHLIHINHNYKFCVICALYILILCYTNGFTYVKQSFWYMERTGVPVLANRLCTTQRHTVLRYKSKSTHKTYIMLSYLWLFKSYMIIMSGKKLRR